MKYDKAVAADTNTLVGSILIIKSGTYVRVRVSSVSAIVAKTSYKCSFCKYCMNSKAYFNESFMMKMKMMNYFCGMVVR